MDLTNIEAMETQTVFLLSMRTRALYSAMVHALRPPEITFMVEEQYTRPPSLACQRRYFLQSQKIPVQTCF